jgi:hypothetical protein
VKDVIFRKNLSAEKQEDFGLLNKIHFILKCSYTLDVDFSSIASMSITDINFTCLNVPQSYI